jgi:oligoendopeptidase F
LHHPSSAAAQAELGPLPEWNLSHLYPGMDSEEFKRDLAKAETECKAFAEAFRGKLDEMARGEKASVRLDEVVKRYEALEDLLGRLMSYAGLVYSGDTTDPVRAKFYGDTQERLTAADRAALLRPRTQSHRRRGSRQGQERGAARSLQAVDRGSAQGQALPARGQD